jgi:hypothetical protein
VGEGHAGGAAGCLRSAECDHPDQLGVRARK